MEKGKKVVGKKDKKVKRIPVKSRWNWLSKGISGDFRDVMKR